MAKVVLNNISKIYEKDNRVVKDISLTIEDKEFMVLVGPSGCGKSTTLRMIAGLEEISGGEILIDDRLVNDVPPKDRDIAMVFQNYALYPHMTVFENMAFGLKLRKYPKNEIKERVLEAADILGLNDYLDRRPKALSGGQRQRVAVGRAIVRKPKVFLFDEPLSNLDAKLRVQMRIEISKLHQRLATTMIYVTHDQVEAMTMGDRITVMNEGIIQQVDKPLHLYNYPSNQFVAGFIGSPAMNFFEGSITKNGGIKFHSDQMDLELPNDVVDRFADLPSGPVTLGVRPEHILTKEPEDTSANKFKAIVEVVEPMGNEMIIYMRGHDRSFILRSDAGWHPQVNQEITLYINLEKIHLFDADTNSSLEKGILPAA
jgi:multiple sugar transport system ATP-binding protein